MNKELKIDNGDETISGIINDIVIQRLIEVGYRHPILDLIRETNEVIADMLDVDLLRVSQ